MTLTNSEILKFTFSGHDSFQCRQLWLKKGYDFVQEEQSFNNEDAVVKLGVGKNMVSAIRYWMKAFNIIDNKDKLTKFGIKIFDTENGYDPFLEDEASLWLLHYQLVKTGLASIYTIIFNEFRKEKLFFTKETFLNYLKRFQEVNPELSFNENTVAKDFTVFLNMYKNDENNNDVEDSFSGILSEIGLLKTIYSTIEDEKGKKIKIEQFQIENNERDGLPDAVVLFSILDNPIFGNSISLNSLEFDTNSPGSIFALNRSGLVNKISDIVSDNKNITFTDHAGIKELQFKNKPDAYSVLDKYYGK
ncbi:DUF4007 family protein [Chryseobacterium lathyri]|uniref:DUF4007 domain-containing protein n=1 Tax=Chryseobacterium lathyri TaxID=395933 RepID=A0A511Y7C9_9FLAO|nr:DUF4007 family protein [Chryseobacterium lathyri]GEN71113.1 hypothetical protein CLA01_11850 [Chryseobacterium lathyri]